MRFIVLAALAGLLCAASPSTFPARVRPVGPAASGSCVAPPGGRAGAFCASRLYGSFFSLHFRVASSAEHYETALTIHCADLPRTVELCVADRLGRKVTAFTVERPATAGHEGALAEVVAARVAKSRKVIDAATSAYFDDSDRVHAPWGVQALSERNARAAIGHFERALETERKTAVYYHALALAHARLGNASRAQWYLAASLVDSGRRAADADAAALAEIALAHKANRDSAGQHEADYAEYRRLAGENRWDEAERALWRALSLAPWYEDACRAQARAAGIAGWDRLASARTRRCDIIRKVNRNAKLLRELNERLAAL